MRILPLLLCALLAGCATAPRQPLPARQQIEDFALEARFSLRSETAGEKTQSASGRLSWTHRAERDHILIATPLGNGVAEIESTPARASLTLADGQQRLADDAEQLLNQATGQPLPIKHIPDWLRGRGSQQASITLDSQGRPQLLLEGDWLVQYNYNDELADSPPARLTVVKGSELELRLRIEEWRSPP